MEPADLRVMNGEPPVSMQNRVQAAVLWWLGCALIIFAVTHSAIGIAGIFCTTAQPEGVNAVRADGKDFMLVILGAFVGILTNRLTTAEH